jgi:hypothetical protein
MFAVRISRRPVMTVKSIFLLAALALSVSLASTAHPLTISERTARKLVQEALVTLGENGSSVDIARWKYYWAPEFYTFSAYRHNLKDGLLVTYYFAVNPWTGDVWDAMACKRISSPILEREQESIWKRSQLPDDVRETLQNRSPACSARDRKPSAVR